jgi:hypothetical protein
MTEAEWWLVCEDPGQLLVRACQLRRMSDRKLRLFAVACSRLVWDQLWYKQSRDAIEMAERYADGLCDRKALLRAGKLASGVVRRSQYREVERVARDAAIADAHKAAVWVRCSLGRALKDDPLQGVTQCVLLREIAGNPFRPSPPLPAAALAWNDGTVRRIAEGIHEERAFDRLPILADALLDAGCDDEELVRHLRAEGPHVRGCWALDVVLGKV